MQPVTEGEELSLDGEVFILLGLQRCRYLNVFTFYHKQNRPDYDHDWTPSITRVLKSMGLINELDYCCIVWSALQEKGAYHISMTTPELFDKYHILTFLNDACLYYRKELCIRIITFWGDGLFTTTSLSKCFLSSPSPKRLEKLMNLTKADMGNITVYPVEGSDLHIKAAEYKSSLY